MNKGVEDVSQPPDSSNEETQVDDKQQVSAPTESSPNSPSAPQAVDSPVSSPEMPIVVTWDKTLYQACVKNKTFSQTPRQVLQEQEQVLRPREDTVILFQPNNEATMIQALVDEISATGSSDRTTTGTTTMKRVWNGVTGAASTVASKVYQYTVADPDDYKEEELDYDEQADDVQIETSKLVNWNAKVVCVEMVKECVTQVLVQCSNNSKKNEIQAVRRNGTGEYSFAAWASRHSTIAQGLQQPHDWNLLQQVLVHAGHAKISGEYLVLGDSLTDTNIQAAVSLAQLKEAIEACEERNEKRQAEIEKHKRIAADKKKKKDVKGALRQLQLCKHLRNQVDSTNAHLLNLYQAHDSLESAHFHATHVVKPLEDTAKALKALRQDVSVEDVDDVMLDLQDELEHVNEMSERMATSAGTAQVDDFNDDELLAELERLTPKDNSAEASDDAKESTAELPPVQSHTEEKENEFVTSNETAELPSADTATKQVSPREDTENDEDDAKSNKVELPAV